METPAKLDLVVRIALAYLDANEIAPEEVAPLIDGIGRSIAAIMPATTADQRPPSAFDV